MNETNNVYGLLGYLIDQAISPYKKFMDGWITKLWHDTASLRQTSQRAGCITYLANK